MNTKGYKVDPNTGALIFSQSPEVQSLQGLKEDIKSLKDLVVKLTQEVNSLKEQIKILTLDR